MHFRVRRLVFVFGRGGRGYQAGIVRLRLHPFENGAPSSQGMHWLSRPAIVFVQNYVRRAVDATADGQRHISVANTLDLNARQLHLIPLENCAYC